MSFAWVILAMSPGNAFLSPPARLLSKSAVLMIDRGMQDYQPIRQPSTSLFSQKKRRRRKDPSSSSENTLDEPSSIDDDLPDFDLIEDDMDSRMEKQPSSKDTSMNLSSVSKSASSVGKVVDVNDPEIIAAMRATKGMESMEVSSTRDLLRSRNRELEEKLVVNDIVQEVPSLADYTKSKTGAEKVGKKALKREARIAAALQAKGDSGESEKSFFDGIPFLKKDGEPKSPIKVRFCFFKYITVLAT